MAKQTTMLLSKKKNISRDLDCSTHFNNIVSICNPYGQVQMSLPECLDPLIMINTFSSHGSLYYINHIISLSTSQKQANKMALAKPFASDNSYTDTR